MRNSLRTVIVQPKNSRREARYQELRQLLIDTFPGRRDIVAHACAGRENSRLWEVTGCEHAYAKGKDLLQWAGTSEKALIEAKLYFNPPIR
jgi:hypothetical protein